MSKLRMLAVGAHPNDVEVGCGGYIQRASHCHIVLLTVGEKGGDPHIRKQEARAAADILRATSNIYNLEDTNINLTHAISILENEVLTVLPNIILTTSQTDTHQDHRITFEATRVAARKTVCTILSYMSPSSMRESSPNWFVSLTTREIEEKMNAIAIHKSQKIRSYLSKDLLLSQGKYWANITHPGYVYVEPYRLVEYWEKK